MGNKHIAICGLDCAECEAFIATANNDDVMRQKVAGEWSVRYKEKGYNRPDLKPSDINCKGCLGEEPIFLYCEQCKIRKCGVDRGLKSCQECLEYKCDDLIKKQSHFWKSNSK